MGRKIVVKHAISGEIAKKIQDDLNDAQTKAVYHSKGPALVIAGAGSGKTRTLTYRVALLIEQNTTPDSIVLVTFTRKAAQEMVHRVIELVGDKAKHVQAGTFHHLAVIVLRKFATQIGFHANFSILDEPDRISFMKRTRIKILSEDIDKKRFPSADDLIDLQSARINLALPLQEVLNDKMPQYSEYFSVLKTILDEYQAEKFRTNQMDFDDLMYYFLMFLEKTESSAAYLKKIKHVLVDEFQDVNAIQARICSLLATHAQSYMVVGDDAQSIYTFRGCDFQYMLNFPQTNPGTTTYYLDTNYRSTPQILTLANKAIAFNKNQFPKNLTAIKPSGEIPMLCECNNIFHQAETLCTIILDNREKNVPLADQAILARTTRSLISMEKTLLQWNIPYVIRGGMRYFEKAHIKDLMALITLFYNPASEQHWLRVLEQFQGLSSKGAEKIIALIHEDHLNHFLKLRASDMKGMHIQAQTLKEITKLQGFFHENIPLAEKPSESALMDLFSNAIEFISPYILENYKNSNPQDRLLELQDVINFMKGYSDLGQFLNDFIVSYDFLGETVEIGVKEQEERPLVLSTIHQAKGLEWEIVYLMDCYENSIPSSRSIGDDKAIEEERRLFYVAVTRAKRDLILSYPIYYRNYQGEDILTHLSPFITDIQGWEHLIEKSDIEG